MKTHSNKNNKVVKPTMASDQTGLPQAYVYPESEDIYSQFFEDTETDPDDITQTKAPNEKPGRPNELSKKQAPFGTDLDMPGGELDDAEELIGNEDEENNLYNRGADNHIDFDED